MLEETTTLCPFCNSEISVKVLRVGKKGTYLVSNECPNCTKPAGKIETALNRSNKMSYVKTEKSYIKLGMKDRK